MPLSIISYLEILQVCLPFNSLEHWKVAFLQASDIEYPEPLYEVMNIPDGSNLLTVHTSTLGDGGVGSGLVGGLGTGHGDGGVGGTGVGGTGIGHG